jgi:4-hydroxy-3-methylbut-2-en-1-yl diphosphate reductase
MACRRRCRPRPRARHVYVDATCPLVTKVHIEAERHHANGLQMVLLIGHAGHPETVGTMGQLPEGEVTLVETVEDVAAVARRDPGGSPSSPRPRSRSTTPPRSSPSCGALPRDRRAAQGGHLLRHHQPAGGGEGDGAAQIDALLVIGAPNSSNSQRLVEVGRARRLPYAQLVQRAAEIDWRALEGAAARSASPPAPRRPRCWSRR